MFKKNLNIVLHKIFLSIFIINIKPSYRRDTVKNILNTAKNHSFV